MRTLAGLACAVAALSAQAQVPVLPSGVRVEILDEATGRPLAGTTTVVGTESYYWTGFHSSGTDCFRAASMAVTSRDGKATLGLPAAVANALRWSNDTRHVHLIAYHPGYCVTSNSSAHWAGFLKWANKNDPQGLWGSVESPKPGAETVLKMTASEDPPERRLRHLQLVARSLAFDCEEVGKGHLKEIRAAVDAEARAVAKTDYEKQLATLVELGWGGDGPSSFQEVDGRDRNGLTSLMRTAKSMDYKAVQSRLAAGERADAVTGPDGYSALDLVLSRAVQDVRETGTEGQALHMLRMIDILAAAKPAPTLRGDYRAELQDPSRWKLSPHLADFWMQVRERVLALPARPVYAAKCAINEPANRSLGLASDRR